LEEAGSAGSWLRAGGKDPLTKQGEKKKKNENPKGIKGEKKGDGQGKSIKTKTSRNLPKLTFIRVKEEESRGREHFLKKLPEAQGILTGTFTLPNIFGLLGGKRRPPSQGVDVGHGKDW